MYTDTDRQVDRPYIESRCPEPYTWAVAYSPVAQVTTGESDAGASMGSLSSANAHPGPTTTDHHDL